LLAAFEKHNVEMIWVKGHAGVEDNERCDQLAMAASQLADLPPDTGYDGKSSPPPLLAQTGSAGIPKSKITMTHEGQQRLSADLPQTGMVVTIDLLDKDIHPPNKFDVGERLARWALAGEYGKELPFSGPLFRRAEFADGKATVHFVHADSGLMIAIRDGLATPQKSSQTKLSRFELADSTGTWRPAEAVIVGQSVVVRSVEVPKPISVRYEAVILLVG